MGLAIQVLGLVVFLGPHVFVTRRDARARLIARIGEGRYNHRPCADRIWLRTLSRQ